MHSETEAFGARDQAASPAEPVAETANAAAHASDGAAGTAEVTVAAPPRGRSATAAAILSFLWPGLGQLYRGGRWSALLHALPPLLVLLALAWSAAAGLERLALRLLTPQVALGATAVVVALGLWRIISILDARRRTRGLAPDAHRRLSLVVAVLLCLLVVGTHGYAAYFTYSFYRAGEQISEPLTGADPSPPPPPPTTPPGGSSPPPTISPSVAPTVLPGQRVNVLFVGIDRGNNYNTNTDTILLASFDPSTGTIVMISIPRDTSQVPLYTGGKWNGKINALYQYAASNPDEFPLGGMGTLVREIEYLIGIPIHYYASVDISGFREMIDLVGGVDVVLERPIADPTYQHAPGEIGFFMEPGHHHLDGATALAYVRSRHGPGGSDFARASRQQQVLLALRQKLQEPGVIMNLPALLDAAARTVRTDVPLDRIPEFVELVKSGQSGETRNIVLAPRRFAERIPRDEIGGAYALRLRMDAVAELSIELFGDDSRYAHEDPVEQPAPSQPLLER